jgi:hypothetical protein
VFEVHAFPVLSSACAIPQVRAYWSTPGCNLLSVS